MNPSEIGAALSGVRWNKATKKQRQAEGARLTEARQAIPPDERSEIARHAAKARWAKKRKVGTK